MAESGIVIAVNIAPAKRLPPTATDCSESVDDEEDDSFEHTDFWTARKLTPGTLRLETRSVCRPPPKRLLLLLGSSEPVKLVLGTAVAIDILLQCFT
jgi:hypothetical protein